MKEGEEFTLSTEFNLRNQTMLYVPKRMPDYRHPTYLAAPSKRSKTS